jgi:hypothetical protein
MNNRPFTKAVFVIITILFVPIFITSCSHEKQNRYTNEGTSAELWGMVESQKLFEADIVVAKQQNTPVFFRDKSLGRPLTKAPVVSAG